MGTDTSSAFDQPRMTAATPKPPRDKVMRIATMTKQLLDEVRTHPLDTAGLHRLRTIDTQIIGELLTDLTPGPTPGTAAARTAAKPPHRVVRC
jgi:hypothetical protein